MKPAKPLIARQQVGLKPLIAQHTIVLRWRDRLKILFTGRLVVFLGREPGAPAGVKVHGAAV